MSAVQCSRCWGRGSHRDDVNLWHRPTGERWVSCAECAGTGQRERCACGATASPGGLWVPGEECYRCYIERSGVAVARR